MAVYPNYAAGQRLTELELQAAQFAVAFKASSTDRSSTTTLTDDPDLKFTLAANAVYLVEWFLHYAGPTIGAPPTTTGTIAVQWTVPSGATGLRGVRGPATNANQSSMDGVSLTAGTYAFNASVQYGARASSSTNQSFAREEALITIGSTGGTCAVKWAQASSNATATRMGAGSWGRALRLS